MVSVLVLAVALLVTDSKSDIVESRFYASSICDVDARISNGCTMQEGKSKGMIRCSMKCANSETCIGASLDGGGSCFIHHECDAVSGCDNEATDHDYMSKTCANGGKLEPSEQRCQCANGWVGPTCQDYPTKCFDLHHAKNTETIVRTKLDVDGDGSYLVPVMCRRHATWYETLAIRNTGERDFNKTWQEYRDGFYIHESHYWMGLEHMHALNSRGMWKTMTVTIYFHVGTITYRRLQDVVMLGSVNGYSLTYVSSSNSLANSNGYTVGNCWLNLQNKPFSAWDKDVDNTPATNCAAGAGSGWWFTDCHPPCNLFGWADHYSSSKPAASIINLAGIDMNVEQGNIKLIHLGLH